MNELQAKTGTGHKYTLADLREFRRDAYGSWMRGEITREQYDAELAKIQGAIGERK